MRNFFEINKRNAKKQNNAHTCGRKSFARIRKEIENETGKEPDRLTMWDATHKKKDGSYVNEEFRKKLEAAHDLQVSYTSSSANFEQNEINEMVFQKIYGAEHNGRVRGLGLGPTPSRYFSVISKFTSTSASTTDNNHKAELENVKLELAEMKDKYEKLSSDLADMKELFGGFMAERSLNDRMSKAPAEEVEDVASVD
ncbi:uncharacterized protein LOC120270271 [Dioscorea cayenensis subsp. rotundata]|uniref:Uncharacterized protein LOC120270271 n=2 Tax=Dioscorea cayennensis subsp. rotundata TaxID=55577 RepID=A0AB40C0D1_DIOCR|nr:uncharacterized protein LOC120270271 [Dioscorea cayenensis subsp. rotundata]